MTRNEARARLTRMRYAGGDPGMAPSCCIIPSASKTPQCSWASPSSPNRMMSISWTSMLLPVARHAHELALVRSCATNARNDLVTADEDVLRVHPKVGKRRPVHVEKLLDAFFGRFEPWRLLVLDEVLRDELAKPVDISGAKQLVHAPHRGRMSHGSSFPADGGAIYRAAAGAIARVTPRRGSRGFRGGHRRRPLPLRPQGFPSLP